MQEIDSQSIRSWRIKNGLTQQELGRLLGMKKVAVTKIESKQRRISESEKKLLRLLMHGELPFNSPLIIRNSSELRFNTKEWEVVESMAKKEGYTDPRQWIVDKIKAYLRMNPESQKAQILAESPTMK